MFRSGILWVKVFLLSAALLLVNGCLLEGIDYEKTGGGTEVHGASLSDAMSASASGGGSISGSTTSDSGTTIWLDNDSSSSSSSASRSSGSSSSGETTTTENVTGAATGTGSVHYQGKDFDWQAPMSVSYTIPFHGPIDSLTRISLAPLSLENEHHYLGLSVGGDIVNFHPGSLPATAIDHTWMLELNFDYRYYVLSSRKPVSPYLAAGGGLQGLYWDYRNPVIVGSSVVHSDDLAGCNGYLGLGISTRRDRPYSAFGEVDFGGMLFGSQTDRGFHNDVFRDFGYFNVKAGVTIKF